MPTIDGINYTFGVLYPYLILIVLGSLLKAFADSFCSYFCNKLSIQSTAGLLDLVYNKILVISETSKNVNAQGSLANILFTDTIKILFFLRVAYQIF